MQQPIKVLIADRYPIINDGLMQLLNNKKEYLIVAQANSCEQIYRVCDQYPPNVLLLSLNHPPIMRIDDISQLNKSYKAVKILLLMDSSNAISLYKLLTAGVAGCVFKTEPTETLFNALSIVAKGQTYFCHDSLMAEINSYHQIHAYSTNGSLSKREMHIIEQVSKGLSNQQIASNMNLAHQTIRNYLSHIYKKLNVQSRAEVIYWALQNRGV